MVKELGDGLVLWGKKHCFEERFPAFMRFDFYSCYLFGNVHRLVNTQIDAVVNNFFEVLFIF
ncbi:MAG: hypothetical protein LBR51_01580 [Bacteroidales bacterium]|nr:hypothetical protein [Bacteroidales bacterium]